MNQLIKLERYLREQLLADTTIKWVVLIVLNITPWAFIFLFDFSMASFGWATLYYTVLIAFCALMMFTDFYGERKDVSKIPSVDSSYSFRTYSKYLLGKPSVKSLIVNATEQAITLWGMVPTLVIDPITNKTGTLPTWTHMIWASGPSQTPEQDGKELVIIWWSELSPDTDRVLDRVLDVVDWHTHAKDVQY